MIGHGLLRGNLGWPHLQVDSRTLLPPSTRDNNPATQRSAIRRSLICTIIVLFSSYIEVSYRTGGLSDGSCYNDHAEELPKVSFAVLFHAYLPRKR